MARLFCLRVGGAVAAFTLGLFIAGFNPFPSAGAGYTGDAPAVSVNRTLKGDRLPESDPAMYAPDWQGEFDSLPRSGPRSEPMMEPRAQMPVGCDRAFSPISSPSLADVYRRCMV